MLNRDTIAVRALRGVLAATGSFPLAAVLGALPGAVLFAASEGASPLHVIAGAVPVMIGLGGATLAGLGLGQWRRIEGSPAELLRTFNE